MQIATLLAFSILSANGPGLNQRLVSAVRGNDVALARQLLDKGANANFRSSDQTPVLLQAFRAKGRVEPMVGLLLDKGAKPDAIDGFGWCALTLAPRDVSADLVKKLLDKGADPNRVAMHGDPAIVRYVASERMDLVKLLLERGAKIDAEGYFGQTALTQAAGQGWMEMIRFLVSKGANPKYVGWNKENAFHFAVRSTRDNQEVLDYFLGLGLDVNAQSQIGMTPLHSAALFGSVDNLKWLLAHGAKVGIKNEKGMTALQAAIEYQNESKQDRSRIIDLLRMQPTGAM